MKLFSTRFHGALDYILGVLLIITPWVLGFASNQASTWVPVIAGAVVILYSLFTNYEYGWMPETPMRRHLFMDGIVGILLAVSPWILNFAEVVYLPHLLMGLLLMVVSVTTATIPSVTRKRKPV